MHTSAILALIVATGVAVATPQSLNDLPTCAQTAVQAAIEASGCSLSSVSCICSSLTSNSNLQTYIVDHCTTSDQANALSDFNTACAPYSITETATVAGATPAAVDSAGATLTTGVVLAGTATSTINPTGAAMGWSVASAWTTSCASTMPTSNSTATLLPYTGAATSYFEYEMAMVLAGVAGLAAFFV